MMVHSRFGDGGCGWKAGKLDVVEVRVYSWRLGDYVSFIALGT
jgi:hypothetical protein